MAGSAQIEKQMATIFQSRIHSNDGVVAPTLFYFHPKNTWLTFQSLSGSSPFMMMLSQNQIDPSSLYSEQSLFSGDPTLGLRNIP
jgi:hypothetical protein